MGCASQRDTRAVEGTHKPPKNEAISKPLMKGSERRESIEKGREGARPAQDLPVLQDEVGGPPDLLVCEVRQQAPCPFLLERQDVKPPTKVPPRDQARKSGAYPTLSVEQQRRAQRPFRNHRVCPQERRPRS